MAKEYFKVAVATSDGVNVDSHFGHVREFTIYRVEAESGLGDAIETRSIQRAACSGDCAEEDVFGSIARKLTDVEYVIAARIGLPAVVALETENITAFDGISKVNEALKKVSSHREKRRLGAERIKKILVANGIEDK
jgi:nitrogen fixation protein NifB